MMGSEEEENGGLRARATNVESIYGGVQRRPGWDYV
jgi:hypothetical protein